MDHVGPRAQLNRPRLIRAPLAGVAAALALGIIAGRYLPMPAITWAAVAAAAFVAAAVTYRRAHLHLLTTISVLACVAAVGAAHLRLVYFSVGSDDIATWAADRPILATVSGRIVTSPEIYDASATVRFGYKRGPQTSFILKASQIRTLQGLRDVSGLARVRVGQADDRLTAGQKVELVCWLGRPRAASNPGQVDQAARARSTGVLANISVPAADGVTILSDHEQPWYARMFWNLRAAARQHLSRCGDEQTAPLLSALVIGERSSALAEMNRQMVRTGVAHFLSISGLHLGVFLGFVYLLCRVLSLAPHRSAAVVLIVLAVYVLLAEPRAPLLRSAIMAAALCAAVIFERGVYPLNAIALAAIVLLAFDPLQLFAPGFQLSFVIVGGLIILHAPVRDAIFGRILRRRGLMVFRDKQRLQRWLYYSAGNWLMSAVAMCLTAYLMAAPLAAYHFGFFSPYAAPMSLILFPLVSAVLIPGYLSLALALPMPNLAHAVGKSASHAADALAAFVDAAVKLPGAWLELRELPVVWVLGCYGLIILIWQHRRIRFGRAWVAAAACAMAAATAWTQLPAPAPKAAELHLLAIGDGQCAVLRTPSGKCFIFDAGTRSGFDASAATLMPFLRQQKLTQPEAAFVSHANTDHYNAIPPLLERGRLRRAYLNEYFGRGGTEQEPEGPEAAAFIRLLEAGGVQAVRLQAGRTIQLDEQTSVEVLWPPAEGRADLAADPNETSLVLRISCGGRSILLPGDIESIARRELLAAGANLHADVLVAPHHGAWSDAQTAGGENLLDAFLKAVAPQVVLVSRGREPDAPLAGGEDRRRFHARMRSAYRYHSTPLNGWICVTLDPDGVKVKTMH